MTRGRTTSKRYRNPEFLKALGERVRNLRVKKGFSIDRLAKEGDQLSPGAIHRLEQGQSDCQVSQLFRIAEVLGIHPKDFWTFDMPESE